MKYLVQWELPPAAVREAAQRFLKTGGSPPDGVTLVGRWHGMNRTGCAVVETADTTALFAYIAEWMELFPIQATPVVEDAEAAQVLASIYG